MKAPSQTPASDASVSYLMNLLAKGKSDRAIQVPVAQPRNTVWISPKIENAENQTTHQLIWASLTLTAISYMLKLTRC